jgi:hypothetical protein
VVTYLPDSNPPAVIAIGPQGADVSTDDGRTWTPVAGATGLHTFSAAPRGRIGWGAGEAGRIMRLTFE